MQDLFLLFPEGESGGRNQRKEINSEQSGSLKDNIIIKKKKKHIVRYCVLWYYGLCTFCTFSLVIILAHCILIIVRCAAANPNPSRSPSSFNVTSGSKKNQQIQSARLSQKLVNDEWIYFNGPS